MYLYGPEVSSKTTFLSVSNGCVIQGDGHPFGYALISELHPALSKMAGIASGFLFLPADQST